MQAYTYTIIQRLDNLNQQRIDRALALMDSQSQQVFHLIPALLNYNHPVIPGYYDADVPYGVHGLELNLIQQQFIDDIQLAIGRPLKTAEKPAILGLYTMGSTSSIGQSTSSDLDIWVCISPEMDCDERELLTNKCLLITDWAQSQGVEANFFLMDEERFRSNHSEEMTGDNCGSSQHLLLLDEFYRSAVRIAGQRLLWQIVPPEMEECYDEYVSQLCSDGYIDCSEWIDFGKLNRIPAEEYFGSNLWQLYKSIDSPYKSVLKAILLEAYSWEYPHTQLLSIDTKRRFFAHEPDLYGMDAYYLMLEKVTRYLERIQDDTRLDLVRRCFYLKTHEKLSREPDVGSVAWRREALSDMIAKWNWDDSVVAELDDRRNWKVEQVKVVHHALLDALMQSYRNLIQFARRNDITSAISPQDISILARKLYAAFEVLPGKVTLLNPQISPDLHEPDLSFIEVKEGGVNKSGWYLYKQPLIAHRILGQPCLEHHEYLSKLVSWAFFNGLITESTRLHAVVREAQLDIDKFYQMVSDLRNTFALRKRRPTMQALASPCEISQLAMFINFENDPTSELSGRSLKVDVKNTDIFSFGPEHKNLVGSVDLVYRNSWHEVRTLHFKGETAMLDALKTILGKMHQDALPPESVDVFCYAKNMRGVMRNMVYQLLAECIDLRLKPVEQEKRRRFKAMRLGNQTYGLFFERRGVSVQKLENSIDFYRSISTNKLKGSPLLMLDREQEYQLPEAVDGFASEGLVQFFFEDNEDGFNIYVLDESNQVEVYHQFSGSKDEMIASVNSFYTSVKDDSRVASKFINFNLPQYYQIIHPEEGNAYIIPYRNDGCSPHRPTKAVNA
ncbi:adenylate cyclase [Vibrio parahaemolyticus]|uniref:class I adenylate cyclase n=1 Tax=Vibrio parahaemolyticus TaxID=670 RepID=UPI0006A57E6B|nr:class I adenylate cyclase [Vibrio parahaemolyticus]EJG0952256.1 class I adenylate cyclase [Vibrio parahaemolyticus O1:K58]EGQ8285782.1 class I adenylate cyclase [Vibrio parahaemolyticus]EGQ8335052.1 class I adenylate cyclase [Vibrio parahaemolyticus]EHV9723744.1 class I adenylate cyclase [Vibrio parahaemolyticus]EIZ1368597.1 class I adenylate cyclase [Vibrio parahaemolyticus]